MKLFRISTVPISLNILLKGQLNFLNRHFEVTAVSGAGTDLDEVYRREGVVVHPIEIERQISPLKDLISLYRLYRYFKKEKPAIVHSITPKAGLLSMIAAKAACVPIRMHTFTGLIFPSRTGLMQKLLIWMDHLLCACATNVYPEGQGVRKDLLKYRITDKPLRVLANGNVNGIDTGFFSAYQYSSQNLVELRKKYGIGPSDFVFVFVGRLVADKGINELVTAFQQIRKSADPQISRSANQHVSTSAHHHIKLLLVGPFEHELDPLLPETLKVIESSSDIITTGYQDDVRPFLAMADALVFPSYREGFPNVVLQAGAMGLPAIVTDINGCNEIIIEGENGTIVPPKEVSPLQQAMDRMVLDTAWRGQLAANARRMISERYEQQVVWEALLEEYRRLLAEKGLAG